MMLASYSLKRYNKFVLPVTLIVSLTVGASVVCDASFVRLWHGLSSSLDFIYRMFPPDWKAFQEMVDPAFQSVIIAFLGTVFGTILSLVLALLAASNITTNWVRNITRFFIGLERSLPEIVILLLLVAAFGLGPMPAIITLAIGCVGMLGKLLADTIEELDPIMMQSMESVGANKLQIISFCVFPQILPSLISFALFRFEFNIRLSVVLGAVGAGGIGYELDYAFNSLEYHRAFTAMLVILLLVFGTERISLMLRKRINTNDSI